MDRSDNIHLKYKPGALSKKVIQFTCIEGSCYYEGDSDENQKGT